MKKLNKENLLLIFIILLPFLDISSFLFRHFFNTSWSIATIIRPIIPIIVFSIIFFKNNFKLKTILIALLYEIYTIIHLVLYNKLFNSISYGNYLYELQYLINYSFNILVLFIFIFTFNKSNLTKFKKCIIISFSIYIFSIYLSIITNTYTPTYIEGTGIKGWFESGNSLSSTLMIGLFIIFALINDTKYKPYLFVLIGLTGIYLLMLIGTRTALFGFIIISLLYIIFESVNKLKNKININRNTIIIFFLIIFCILFSIFIVGSKTLERRQYLNSLNLSIDQHTGQILHVTSSIADLKYNIDNNTYDSSYISNAEINALNHLYTYANKHKISCTNRRLQELMYNIYLVKYQKSFINIIFGNGLLNNFSELILEIELPAFILNFGILGFTLYLLPFIIIFIYAFYSACKNKKLIDNEFLMLLSGLLFAFASTCFTGVTFFNTSSATLVTLICILLINKIQTRKELA